VRLEGAPNAQIERGFEIALAVFRIVDPDGKLEVDTAFGEADDQDHRRIRLAQHARLSQRDIRHEPHREIEIAVVADLNRHSELDVAAGVGVTEYRRRDHGLVWHDRLDAVEALHDNVAGGRLALDAK